MRKPVSLFLLAIALCIFLSSCSLNGGHSEPDSASQYESGVSGTTEEPGENSDLPLEDEWDSEQNPSSGIVSEQDDPSSEQIESGESSNLSGDNLKPETAEKTEEPDGQQPISPQVYQKRLGKGMDVDWSKTSQGRKYYNQQAAANFSAAGVSHVRIRIADKATDDLLEGLDRQIEDCLANGIIPIIAYQADEFKNEPSEENIRQVVDWWSTVAARYKDTSYLLSFDLLIEATDALNKQPEKLNEIYERLVTEIRKTNPNRIIMISPRLRSDAAYLCELEIPTGHNGYLMAEWHFYAAGPSKTNERKLWTSGTEHERSLIDEKIRIALEWQLQTGIPTWVGAWMPGNYNSGNDYTIEEQIVFASYMTKQLTDAGIPFAVNSDTKFYDRESNEWIPEMLPVFHCIYS